MITWLLGILRIVSYVPLWALFASYAILFRMPYIAGGGSDKVWKWEKKVAEWLFLE